MNSRKYWYINSAKDADAVIHLASIVGTPSCKKNETLARETNVLVTKNIIDNLLSNEQIFLFASTGSIYGKIEGMCDEDWEPSTLSFYGSTKLEGEKMALNRENSVAFWFATTYGLSPRLRLDLLPNDFVLNAISNKYLVVYDKEFTFNANLGFSLKWILSIFIYGLTLIILKGFTISEYIFFKGILSKYLSFSNDY